MQKILVLWYFSLVLPHGKLAFINHLFIVQQANFHFLDGNQGVLFTENGLSPRMKWFSSRGQA